MVIVTCGARKGTLPAQAADLYTGPYYRACMRYAQVIAPPERIRILSAKHGLLRLDDVTAPYEQTLGQPGAIAPSAVRLQASQQNIIGEQQVVVLGGSNYVALARKVWPHATAPLAGMRMGNQMRWLKHHTATRRAP